MKHIVKFTWMAFTLILGLSACSEKDINNNLANQLRITDDQVSFTYAASPKSDNILVFTNTSSINAPYSFVWDLGNGTTSKAASPSGIYPNAGDYTVTFSVYGADGSTVVKTQAIHIANNDYSLFDTPNYRNLTGGADNTEGKTWVFDEYHDGHFGVGPASGDGSDAPSWWSCPANGKDGSSLYTQEFTFIQDGTKLIWKNNGAVYTNAAGVAGLAALGYNSAADTPVGDFDVQYAPKDSYTFTLNEEDMTLSISDNGFFGHFAGAPMTYQILSLTENELYLRCASTVEPGNAWYYRFIPKDQNVKPQVAIKAVPLFEDFESATPSVEFVSQDMGTLTAAHFQNPWPTSDNMSDYVFRYQKSNAFYSNISFVAPDYIFDLTEVNQIKMKVFIPSQNDYTTAGNVDGDWITNNKLAPKVAVKLQNNGLGGNAYTTQVEQDFNNVEFDKWVELTFDFSDASSRQDLNKIVIQFGDEGHDRPGIFFFDDFSFDKK